MRLHSYLREQGLTDEQFAHMLGVSSFAVGKWRRGERCPRPGVMRRIIAATAGQVGPADFYAAPLREADAVDAANDDAVRRGQVAAYAPPRRHRRTEAA